MKPAKLRAYAEQFEIAPYAPIAAKDCGMLADAVEIADSCARSNIECECKGSFEDGYDLASADYPEALEQAVRYLLARGLIERHPEWPDLVRVKA